MPGISMNCSLSLFSYKQLRYYKNYIQHVFLCDRSRETLDLIREKLRNDRVDPNRIDAGQLWCRYLRGRTFAYKAKRKFLRKEAHPILVFLRTRRKPHLTQQEIRAALRHGSKIFSSAKLRAVKHNIKMKDYYTRLLHAYCEFVGRSDLTIFIESHNWRSTRSTIHYEQTIKQIQFDQLVQQAHCLQVPDSI
jgi:hypothetical protein